MLLCSRGIKTITIDQSLPSKQIKLYLKIYKIWISLHQWVARSRLCGNQCWDTTLQGRKVAGGWLRLERVWLQWEDGHQQHQQHRSAQVQWLVLAGTRHSLIRHCTITVVKWIISSLENYYWLLDWVHSKHLDISVFEKYWIILLNSPFSCFC